MAEKDFITLQDAGKIFGLSSAALRGLFHRNKPQTLYGLHYIKSGVSGSKNLLCAKKVAEIKKELAESGKRFCCTLDAEFIGLRQAAALLGVHYHQMRYLYRAGYLRAAEIEPLKIKKSSGVFVFFKKQDIISRKKAVAKPRFYSKKATSPAK
jgi:hypothetical protein